MLKLYSELAPWWPLVSHPDDYAEEAAFFLKIFHQAGLPASASLLELGCGGGNNASYLKKVFAQVTLTDLSPDMLAMSRGLNPECEHLQGDMRSLRLGRMFDAVFIHDAIMYMTTLDSLRQAIETASIHCKPGGTVLLVPDWVRETFEPSTSHHGHDEVGRAMRYLEWTYDPDESDTQYTVEFAYVLHEGSQPTRYDHEAHTFGLFPRADWLRLMEEAGCSAKAVVDEYNRDLFVGRKNPAVDQAG